jgi:hypothetical protein
MPGRVLFAVRINELKECADIQLTLGLWWEDQNMVVRSLSEFE